MTGFEAKTILKNTAFLATVSTFQAIEDAVQTAIDALDKQERTGKWIDCNDNVATCSVCDSRWGLYRLLNYCPNCGADMREDSE